MRPRQSAQKFICTEAERCEWNPPDERIRFEKLVVQFWSEREGSKHRYRKYNPDVGMVTALVRDFATGIEGE